MNIRKLLRLDFLPRSTAGGLLVLRLWLGLSLLLLHGWSKLASFSEMAGNFPDPIGLGSSTSLALAIFAEVACAPLIVAGVFTRAAALTQTILMSVVLITGAGRLSFDGELGAVRR